MDAEWPMCLRSLPHADGLHRLLLAILSLRAWSHHTPRTTRVGVRQSFTEIRSYQQAEDSHIVYHLPFIISKKTHKSERAIYPIMSNIMSSRALPSQSQRQGASLRAALKQPRNLALCLH